MSEVATGSWPRSRSCEGLGRDPARRLRRRRVVPLRGTDRRDRRRARRGHRHVRVRGEERFDLVVGADGQHSQVRAAVLGDGPDLVRPMGTHVAWWRTDNHLGLRDRALDHIDGERVVGVRPVDGNRSAAAYLGFPSTGLPQGPFDAAQQVRIVREQAAGMGWEVPRLVARIDEPGAELYLDEFCQVVLDTWPHGRVTLLGDAGYCPSPLSGQGTSIALVGAYVLAEELAAADEHAVAPAAYEQRLRPWVERTQALARNGADGASISTLASDFALRRE